MNTSPVASSSAAVPNMAPILRSPAHRRDTSSESGTKRIPSEQWEAKRGIITQLYQEEKKSLKEVMDFLEREHGFSATVKMFKSRIWKWGLDKKLKSDEVLAIMVLKRDRDLANKPSEFTIRGQPVDMDNINRYIKRNPQLVARFNAGEVPQMQTTLEVQCRTPSPRPSTLPPTPQLVATSRATSPAQREVLVLLQEYVEDSFYTGRWRWEYDVKCETRAVEDRSDELFERTLTSLALINRYMARSEVTPLGGMLEPSLASINEMLNPVFAALRELVALQSPIFATRMLSLLWFLDTHQQSPLLQLIVTQLASLVADVLGPAHLMAQIWNRLAADAGYDYRGFCEAAYATLIPLLETRIGPANMITTMMYGDHVDSLFTSGRLDEARSVCEEYLAKVEGTGRRHPWVTGLQEAKGAILEAQEDINGAIAAMDLELLTAAAASDPHVPTERQAQLFLRQGNMGMQAGDVPAAALQYSQAVQVLGDGGSGSGGDERLLLTSLANLEAAQMRLGNVTAAQETRAARGRVQRGFAAETSAVAGEQRRWRGSVGSSEGGEFYSLSSGRRSSGLDIEGGEDQAAGGGGPGWTVPTTVGTMTAAASPGISGGSEAGWGQWSPEMFVSPGSESLAMNGWRFPMGEM